MAKWGRSAGIADIPAARGGWSLGGKSMLCAILAPVLVTAAVVFMVNVPPDAAEWVGGAATTIMVAVYLLVAPVLHITGAVFALRGLFREGDRPGLCVLGLLLNVGLLVSGAVLGWIAMGNIGAFT